MGRTYSTRCDGIADLTAISGAKAFCQYLHWMTADETRHLCEGFNFSWACEHWETGKKQLLASLQFCAGIRFNKCRMKSSVRASERRPPSQANAVTTLASQSLNVCKYCNKQQGFPHKRCSSSTGTDRRYGPWLQDKERCLPLSSPLFRRFFEEISNLRRRQGRSLLEVSVHTPNSPGFYSVSL